MTDFATPLAGYGNSPDAYGSLQSQGFGGTQNFSSFNSYGDYGGSGGSPDQGGWNWLDNDKQQGVLSPMIQGIGSAANIYMGLKGLGLQEDQFNFNKQAYTEGRDAQYADYSNRQSAAASRRAGAMSNEELNVGNYTDRNAAEAAYVAAEVDRTKIGG